MHKRFLQSPIRKTPLIELKDPSYVGRIFAKVERFQPTGSIKDRVGFALIEDAFERGTLFEGGCIVEATSGNTGIGLAFAAQSFGVQAVIVMPDNMSKERIDAMRAFGATVILTPAHLGMAGAIEKAEAYAKEHGGVLAGQFENPANVRAHYEGTGPEILEDLPDVDILVAGVGTGGTITGIAKFLKEKKKTVRIVAVEPGSSAVLSGKSAGSHAIQGIGAGFVPKILDLSLIDEVKAISDETAIAETLRLKNDFDLFCGISSGAAFAVAEELARKEAVKIAVILPDGGEKYLSTGIFD